MKTIGIAVLQGEFKGVENTIVVQLFGSQLPAVREENEIAEQPAEPAIADIEQAEPKAATSMKSFDSTSDLEAGEGMARVAGGMEIASFQGEVSEGFSGAANDTLKLKFYRFMAIHYHNLLEGLIFYSLIFVSLILMLNVFVKISIQHKGLTIKTLTLIFLLVLCVYINKDIMLKLIPHVVSVY